MALMEAVGAVGVMSDLFFKSKEGELTEEQLKRAAADLNLVSSGGNIFRYLGKYIVTPTIFISKDLEGTPSEIDAINAQLNVFVASYVQAFQIMTGIDGVNANEAINFLSTSKGSLGEAITSTGYKAAINVMKMAKTECDLTNRVQKFIGVSPTTHYNNVNKKYEMMRVKQESDIDVDLISVNECYSRIKVAMENKGMKVESDLENIIMEKAPNGMNKGELEDIIDFTYKQEDADSKTVKDKIGSSQFGTNKKQNIGADVGEIKEDVKDIKSITTRSAKTVDEVKKILKAKDNASKKEAIISATNQTIKEQQSHPTYNYFMRSFELQCKVGDNSSRDGKAYTINIPITVKAHIFYISHDAIDSQVQISNKNEDNSFSAQWSDYRTGAKSFWDVVMANTLVNNYRKNLQKDTEDMLAKLEANAKSGQMNTLASMGSSAANLLLDKTVLKHSAHFQSYYNLLILSSRTIERLGGKVGNLRNGGDKDRFMDKLNAQQLLVLDYEYETFQLYLLNIDGESKGRLNNLNKKSSDDKADDILKALLGNVVPRI